MVNKLISLDWIENYRNLDEHWLVILLFWGEFCPVHHNSILFKFKDMKYA
jgi:hypothetical protein